MNRSKDLDTIAPDDLIVESNPESTPIIEEKTETELIPEIKNEPVIESEPKSSPKTPKKIVFPKKIYDILGHTKSPFSSFLVHPKVLTFPERDIDEEIYLALRPHWFTNFKWMVLATIMLLIPFLFKYLSFLNILPINYQFEITLFWFLLTFLYTFEKFLSWYFNVFIVTSQRVVDIDFHNMLNKHFGEADLDMIQDVSSSVKGIFGTFLNFGDVLIQTASEINQINFEKVPNPEKVIRLLRELREETEVKIEGGKK